MLNEIIPGTEETSEGLTVTHLYTDATTHSVKGYHCAGEVAIAAATERNQ